MLPLDEALVAWCDPRLVAAVKRAERPFIPEILQLGERPHLGGGEAAYRPGQRVSSDHLRTEGLILDQAWERLMLDFRRRIDREELFLYGVRSDAAGDEPRQMIPNAWAADLEFELTKGVATRWHVRYVSVRCSDARYVACQADRAATTRAWSGVAAAQLHASDVPSLSDELASALVDAHARRSGWPGIDPFLASEIGGMNSAQVAALLERHVDDVLRDTGIDLLPPGKASRLPLIVRKMEERGRAGEMLETLAAEAEWLARWAARAAPSHFDVQAKTIKNKMSGLYADLKKAMIARR